MTKRAIKHYPRQARCKNCADCHNDCSSKPFEKMPIYRQDGTDTIVICTDFRQANHFDSLHSVVRRGGQNQ
ncbi:hypothetical protein [Pseudomonas sp. USHLN015]|uniref:hypothetical protein n=1 Tax=Pseudomonas sp. USHLN015 TaxID=3081296 RepID=UPI00301E0891